VTGKPSMALLIKLIGAPPVAVRANAGQTFAQVREYVKTNSKRNADFELVMDSWDDASSDALFTPAMDDKTLEQAGFLAGVTVTQKPV